MKQKYKKFLGTNPYKGFVPFIGKYNMDSSMEFFYIPLNKIIVAQDNISWIEFERNLTEIDGRNHTAIIRVYIDYPTLECGLPEYMKEKVDLANYDEFGGGIGPNYDNDYLINELIKFIKVFGKKYDGDLRIAFIECGLIGHWGEWHTYPNNEFMSTEKQLEKIIKAYLKNFKKTRILTRYPKYNFLKKYHIGFHDDSFCYSTLPYKNGHFVAELRKNQFDKYYLRSPIGGELRPEEQENLLLNKPTKEDYNTCVINTNCSWLINQKAFEEIGNPEYIKLLSTKLGYDFYINDIEISRKNICFNLYNVGVAPIYYDFDCNLIITCNHKKTKINIKYDLRKLLPNKKHKFCYNISRFKNIEEITFSLEKGEQVIHLSNVLKKDHYVILFEKSR